MKKFREKIPIIQIAFVSLLMLFFLFVACIQVNASTISDGDNQLAIFTIDGEEYYLETVEGPELYAVSSVPDRDGYTTVDIGNGSAMYVPDKVVNGGYWISLQTGSYGNITVYSDSPIYYNAAFENLCFSTDLINFVDYSGDVYMGTSQDGTCDDCGLFTSSLLSVVQVYDGNYLTCGDPTVTEPPGSVNVTVTFPPTPTEVPFFEATPDDLSITNILLLLILFVLAGDFILKRVGGVFRCTR